MPFNVTAKNVMLDALDESATAGIKYLGILGVTDPGTSTDHTGVEATGGSPAYARQAATFAAAASGSKANSGSTVTFDVPAGTYAFVGFFNTSSGNSGSYLGYAPINGTVKGFGEVDSTGVTNDTITSSGHGLTTGDAVIVYNVFAESIPTGLTEGTIYYVIASGLTTDVFKVSATLGGSAVNLTGQGEVYFQKVVPETFASQGQITIAVSALTLVTEVI